MKPRARVLLTVVLLSGCRSVPTTSNDTDVFFTDQMRKACPTLSDDVLAGYVAAIDRLRTQEGISEVDALIAWVQGCDSIPPDGNFGGDPELCIACVTALVEEVYR